jgi:uncharacterized protein (TIGR02271 family)
MDQPLNTNDRQDAHRIAALFETRAEAERAVAALEQANVPRSHIHIVAQDTETLGGAGAEPDESGFWSWLRGLFGGEDEHHTYAEGIRRGGCLVSVDTDAGESEQVARILEDCNPIDLEERAAEWQLSGAPRQAGPASAPTGASGLYNTASSHAPGDERIPIAQESLKVGKRQVDRGTVRVRSYVVEQPVSESIELRRESVQVERQAVDADSRLGDNPFQERTVEVTETDEEPVVSKEAQVVEEVVVNKRAEQHTETIQDNVRQTKVDVEDTRAPEGTKR